MTDAAFEHARGETQNSDTTGNIPESKNTDAAELPAVIASASSRELMSTRETLDFRISGDSGNKLLELAMPLLGLAVRIRNMGLFEDIDALHSRASNEISNFQHEAAALEYDDATILAARYCLCSMIDESVLSQQWGAESLWPERPMLAIFHNETWGGEKVFAILDRVLDEAHRFPDLLEFIYFCIALGFEGKYHVMHNGQAKLEGLLDSVYKVLEKQEGEAPERLLHPEPNIFDQKQRMGWRIPVWLVVVLGCAAVLGVHLYFDQTLTREISKIGTQIQDTLGIEE